MRILNWSQGELAKKAGIGIATVQRMERGEGMVSGHVATVVQLQRILEKAGIRFISDDETGGVGVWLKSRR